MFSRIGSIRLRNACVRRSRYRFIALMAGVIALVAGDHRVQAQADGAAAAYAFSETSGVTAVDSSGNGNDATLVNGPTWTTGRFGGGLQLDGVDDAVQLPITESLAFSSAFTVEAWIAPATLGRDRSLWWTPNAMLTLRTDGTLVPVAILTGGQVGFASSGTVPVDIWSHVAVTYDGRMLRLYINGAEAGSSPATGTLGPAWPPEAGILGGASGFAGTIDEVRLYRRALSQSEIWLDSATSVDPALPLEISAQTPPPNAVGVVRTAMAVTFSRAVDAGTITTSTLEVSDSANVVALATVTYDAATRTATLSPTSALTPLMSYTMRVVGGTLGVHDALGVPLATEVAWTFRTAASETAPSAAYSFSETSGVTAVDSSGNGNDATFVNGPTWTTGRFGGGLQLDGVDDAVQLPITESLAFSSAFTVEAWIAPATLGRDRSLWWTPNAMLTLRADGTLVPVAILTGGQVGFASSGTVPVDIWSHVAVTYDGRMLRLYINGAEAGSSPATGTLGPASPPEAGILGGASGFAGTIDEVRLYRRALNAIEIVADMTGVVEPASTPFAVTSTTPANQTVDVVSSTISATFSRPADAGSVTTATMQLRDSADQVVAASVTYDGATRSVTLTPTSPLVSPGYYYARVLGGSGGVKAEDGGELASDAQWSFRTASAVPAPVAPLPPPHITSLSVTSGRIGQALFVNGSNFGTPRGTSTLTFNGTRATVVDWSSARIWVIVPRGATTGPMVVDVGGRVSNPVTFSVAPHVKLNQPGKGHSGPDRDDRRQQSRRNTRGQHRHVQRGGGTGRR